MVVRALASKFLNLTTIGGIKNSQPGLKPNGGDFGTVARKSDFENRFRVSLADNGCC